MKVDPYYCLLGIATAEQPADHYRLLGIERLELNTDVIVNAAERQLDHLKRFSATHSQHVAELGQEIENARDCLLDGKSHCLYAAALQGFEWDGVEVVQDFELESTQPDVAKSPGLVKIHLHLRADTAVARSRSARFDSMLQFLKSTSPQSINADYLERAETLATTEIEKAAFREVRERFDEWEVAERTRQTDSALQRLDSYSQQLDEVDAGIEAGRTASQNQIETRLSSRDRALISSIVRGIDSLNDAFPKRSDEVDEQVESLKVRASAMLEAIPTNAPSVAVKQPSRQTSPRTSLTSPPPQQHEASIEPSLSGTPFTVPRQWHRKSGSTFVATVADLAEDRIRFQIPEQDQVIDMRLEDLSPADEADVRVAFYGDQETKQFDRTRTLVSRVASSPAESVATFRESHNDLRDCPYAGLWASVCLSLGENRHGEAATMLRQVISRIRRQQNVDATRPNCSGRGGFDCPHCKDGRLPLQAMDHDR